MFQTSYKRWDEPFEETICYVCQDEFEEREELMKFPVCGHKFHALCLEGWLKTSRRCPLCSAAFRYNFITFLIEVKRRNGSILNTTSREFEEPVNQNAVERGEDHQNSP